MHDTVAIFGMWDRSTCIYYPAYSRAQVLWIQFFGMASGAGKFGPVFVLKEDAVATETSSCHLGQDCNKATSSPAKDSHY